jgi:hypothetical protein
MLPTLNSILHVLPTDKPERFYWCVSVCYKQEQTLTFIEVSRTIREKKEWKGKKQNLVKFAEYSFIRYQNGLSIVSFNRSYLDAAINEKRVKIVDLNILLTTTEKEMNEVLKKEMR